MISMPPSLWLYCICAVFALVARISVESLEGDDGALERIPFLSLVLVSCLATAAALFFADPETQHTAPQLIGAFLVGQLAMAGWIDRQTTWVPDTVLLMVLSVSSAYVLSHATSPAGLLQKLEDAGLQGASTIVSRWPEAQLFILSVIAGVAIWLVTILLWRLQVLFERGFLTPPDIVALGLPIYCLGVTLEAGFVYLVAVCLAVIMLRSEFLRSVFSNPDAVKEGRDHLGLKDDGPAVAVLSLMFSILAVVIVAREPLQAALGDLFSCTAPSLAGPFICP